MVSYVVFRVIDSTYMLVEKHTRDGNAGMLRIYRKKPFVIDVWYSNRIIFTVTDKTIFFSRTVVLGEYLSMVREDSTYDGVIQVTVIDLKNPSVKVYIDPEPVPYKVLKPQEVPEAIRDRVMNYITFFVLQGHDFVLYEGLFQFDGVRLSSTKIPGFRTGWWE